MTKLVNPVDDGHCIGCGPQSPIGLHMRFLAAPDGGVECALEIPSDFQGWRDVVHGGIVALLLDEAMAYAAAAAGLLGVTAEIGLRFRAAVPVGAPLVVRGKVLWRRRNVLGIAASVRDAALTVLAEAEGKFVTRGTLPPGRRFGTMDAS